MTNTWNNDNSKIRKVLNTRNNDKVLNFQLSLILKIVENEKKIVVFFLKKRTSLNLNFGRQYKMDIAL